MSKTGWFRSTYCAENTCVEVNGDAAPVVQMRDGKNPDGPVLTFDPPAWRNFVTAVRRGDVVWT